MTRLSGFFLSIRNSPMTAVAEAVILPLQQLAGLVNFKRILASKTRIVKNG